MPNIFYACENACKICIAWLSVAIATRRKIHTNQNQIVFIIFRLIWNQTDFRLIPKQSENSKYNLFPITWTRMRVFPSYLLCALLLFPFHLLPSPVHLTGCSFCFFPGFLAIFILLLSQQQQQQRRVLFDFRFLPDL